MARADSSPKAIVKAAIRSRCHVIAKRYPHQRLERLHGSNVKWLVLSEELFDEVCSEFTIQKLDMDRAEKRALFDADWVPQVTYELITKPSRPRRRRSQQEMANAAARTIDKAPPSMPCEMTWEPTNARRTSAPEVSPTDSTYSSRSFPESFDRSSRYWSSIDSSEAESAAAGYVGRHDSVTSTLSAVSEESTPKPSSSIAPRDNTAVSQPQWFETVLN
ncbi:uncharacterized protein RCC_02960 [Ramularia collo-cygni]|uniref:Uncharacterized protein n=1 Tax=Ramularia collo-cygni TaxID=112498 RepID=A0A2D3URG0_9PEZI|nr:uncharacterized protein RCC_02960 [Ramularia collo-cygni]CZT17128.1 uncharacterized protein RCC_02960 [Ramularia collo-cygni]